MTHTQADRPMRVDTVLGTDVLLLDSFHGSEGISRPYEFELDVLSESTDVDGESLLRTAAALTYSLPDGSSQWTHGLVSRVIQLGQRDELTAYRLHIVPWLWFLSLSRESRIYQNLSVLDIVQQVFQDLGHADFEIRCSASYSPREYCVQYRETHLDFVSRLLEDEGIFYFFEHSSDKHVLVLADGNNAAAPVAGSAAARFHTQRVGGEDIVWSIEREHAVQVGKVTLRDYDFLQPSHTLESSQQQNGGEEVYDYPGKYNKLQDGDRYARLQLEAEQMWRSTVRGEGNCRGFHSGFSVELEDHYRSDVNAKYLVVSVHHVMVGNGYRSWSDFQGMEYRNSFQAVPFEKPYRPRRVTPRALIHGSQTAVVVGTAGEEIWTDKYGRVKVQFHWDRQGHKNESSSCWVRVSSSWAGKGWGAVSLPRIGQEVVVDFLDGDPDRPLITGRVYNAEQMPPYDLPANATQSGIKSRSSKQGAASNFNEIRMEDRKGSELLYVHAEKDKQVLVENNRNESVGVDETISIGSNRSETVGKNETISIGQNRSESVAKNETVTVGDNRTVSIGKNETLDVGKDRDQSIGGKETVSITDKRTTNVGKDDELTVGKKLIITAGDQILLKTGSASIEMKKDGTIVIKGKDITIQGSGKILAKASADITLKGSQIKQN